MERTMHLPLGSVSLTAVQGLGWLQTHVSSHFVMVTAW
jgi:hypothetical protein